jgi:carboxyl-terminal processing protease
MGMSLNFPDVCKTPAPPAPFIPVPYPDIGMNMMAAPFSPFVFVQFVPATNMASLKVMTTGDEAGAMGGLITGIIKGPGKLTMGNPIVLVTGLPGESLALPTSGNMMNAPVGAQIVPSVVNVLYTYRHAQLECERSGDASPVALTEGDVRVLRDAAAGEGESAAAARVIARWQSPGIAYLRIGLFSSHVDREVYNALRRLGLDDIRTLVLDLRGNPGGDADAALRLAGACLPPGTVMLRELDGDGDEEEIVARGTQSYFWPLRVLIDGQTASAAELFTAALQHQGRATVVGQPSYGKATGQRAMRWPDGSLRYATVKQYFLPDGAAIEGCGVTPDVIVDATAEGA